MNFSSHHPTAPVSLILTTLNEEGSIDRFMASLTLQTVLPEEVVICDGGSVDRTLECLDAWAHHGFALRLVVEPRASIAQGRNRAIAEARREVILVSDAGCTLEAEWVERLTATMALHPEAAAIAGFYRIEGRTTFERCAAAAEVPLRRIPSERFLPSSRSFAVRKSAWQKVGGYPEYLSFAGEDTEFCLSLQRAGFLIVPAPEARVIWTPRSTLRAYWKQHRLYGKGDREAANNAGLYSKIAVKLVLGMLFLGLSFLRWEVLAFLVFGFVVYGLHLAPIYEWRSQPWGRALCAFLLILVKEAALLTGYLGAVRRRPLSIIEDAQPQ